MLQDLTIICILLTFSRGVSAMYLSRLFFYTSKEIPSDAEIISHQLMLRAGFIQKLGSGLYTWLPLGLRVMQKIMNIVREEMNAIHGQEILMPSIQPAALWHETGRWDKMGRELLKIKDRHQRDFCYGPTHEEVVSDVVRQTVQSYKELPLTLYQIQTKFRDEIRPRFGVMRAREFTMKDAYSFHLTRESLQQTYDDMYRAYSNIFSRMGFNFRAVFADTGAIGGHASHEFHVLAESGEDIIAYSDTSDYAANLELATAKIEATTAPSVLQEKTKIASPGIKTIAELSQFLNAPAAAMIKTIIVKGTEQPLVALLLCGDDEINLCKLAKLKEIQHPVVFADATEIMHVCGCGPGSIGPIDLKLPIIADARVLSLHNFMCGANEADVHFTGVNFGRDLPIPKTADIRLVKEHDLSPDGQGRLKFARGIEVGHIFQLGTKYSEAMHLLANDEHGERKALEMGCYGIGISRIVAACIEQSHDAAGIIWPQAIAPFQIILVALQYQQSKRVQFAADALYKKLMEHGFEVLLDDRDLRPGHKFADSDLIGIPHRLVISERCVDNGTIEYKARNSSEKKDIAVDSLLHFLDDVCHVE